MKKEKTSIKICYILIFILIIGCILTLFFPKTQYTTKSFEVENPSIMGELKNGDILEQQFVSDGNYEKIGFSLATYSQLMNNGNLDIEIINQDESSSHKKIKLYNVIDNTRYYVNYKFKKNKIYRIKITVKNIQSPITLYTTMTKMENTYLKYNNYDRNDNLQLSFMSKKNNYFNIWYYLVAIVLLLCYIVLMKDKENDYENKK